MPPHGQGRADRHQDVEPLLRLIEEKRDPLEEIDADLKACTDRIKQLIEEMSA